MATRVVFEATVKSNGYGVAKETAREVEEVLGLEEGSVRTSGDSVVVLREGDCNGLSARLAMSKETK